MPVIGISVWFKKYKLESNRLFCIVLPKVLMVYFAISVYNSSSYPMYNFVQNILIITQYVTYLRNGLKNLGQTE